MSKGSKTALKEEIDKVPTLTAEIFDRCTVISYEGTNVLRVWDINLIRGGTLKPYGRTNKFKDYVKVPFDVRLEIVNIVSDYWEIPDDELGGLEPW